MSTRLALNSYTVRGKLNTPNNVEDTFRQLRDIGYGAIELDLDGLLLQLDSGELKDLLEKLGLRAFSAHTGFERLENGFEDSIASFKELGLEYVIVPSLPRDRFCRDEEGWTTGARMLASFSQGLSKEGIRLAYHNHSKEFEKYNGKTAMDIVFCESNWQNYLAEIDVYWVQFGGGNPAEWIRKFSGRVPLVHIKDYGIVDGKPMTVEVGEGNLNLPDILDASNGSGVKWYVVEQDDSLRDPLESLRMSKTYLERLGVN